MFSNASSIKRILCPAKNAFDRIKEIESSVLKFGNKGEIILLALGMTATVLAYDLTLYGYQAVDIGHVDIEYEWYLRKATDKVAINNKFTNECDDGHNPGMINDNQYMSEIVERIE